MSEDTRFLHTDYSSSDERKKNMKKDAFLFDCICESYLSYMRGNKNGNC